MDELAPPTAEPGLPLWRKATIVVVAFLFVLGAVVFGAGSIGQLGSMTVLHSMFGDPYEQLPSDFRTGIETRVKALTPPNFDKLSETEQAAWIQKQVEGGLARLDDTTLTRRLGLWVEADAQMSVPDCAAYNREEQGLKHSRASNDAFLAALDGGGRREWIEILVQAMEADAHPMDYRRVPTNDEVDRLFAAIYDAATPDERTAISGWAPAFPQTDEVVCASVRAEDAASGRLRSADLVTLARFRQRPDCIMGTGEPVPC